MFTFGRLVQTSVEDLLYGRAINRIRGFYRGLAGEDARYLLLGAHDDVYEVLADMGMPSPRRQLWFTLAAMLTVSDSVIAGTTPASERIGAARESCLANCRRMLAQPAPERLAEGFRSFDRNHVSAVGNFGIRGRLSDCPFGHVPVGAGPGTGDEVNRHASEKLAQHQAIFRRRCVGDDGTSHRMDGAGRLERERLDSRPDAGLSGLNTLISKPPLRVRPVLRQQLFGVAGAHFRQLPGPERVGEREIALDVDKCPHTCRKASREPGADHTAHGMSDQVHAAAWKRLIDLLQELTDLPVDRESWGRLRGGRPVPQ